MKTFIEWLEQEHPKELTNEGVLDFLGRKGGYARDYMTKFALPATAALGLGMGIDGMRSKDHHASPRPAAVSVMGGQNNSKNNNDFISYAAQQVERQLGGSQNSIIPKPEGWDDLDKETKYKIYQYAHEALVRQYDVKDKDELKRMFNRETAQGRYNGSNL